MAGCIREAVEPYKPCAAMVATQCIFAAMTLWVKAAFGRGMSPMVFVVYRQAVATLVLAPIALVANRTRLKETKLGTRGFFLVFVAALFGATVNQNLCYQGLHLGSSSLATTMTNLIPAITFVMAVAVGQERVNIGEVSSIAKISGTVVCVGGAATLAFFKGPKLLNNSLADPSMPLNTLGSKWVMGALLLMVSSSCWSFWLILQGPICKSYVDPLTFVGMDMLLVHPTVRAGCLLSAAGPERLEDSLPLRALMLHLRRRVRVRGELLPSVVVHLGERPSLLRQPLCTVLTTVLAAVLLHEELHVGSVIGAVAIIVGLYVVLWGKSQDARKAAAPAQTDPENTLAAPLIADAPRAQDQPN